MSVHSGSLFAELDAKGIDRQIIIFYLRLPIVAPGNGIGKIFSVIEFPRKGEPRPPIGEVYKNDFRVARSFSSALSVLVAISARLWSCLMPMPKR
jgi:hypothetical protein